MAAPRASRRPRASNRAVPAYRRRLPGRAAAAVMGQPITISSWRPSTGSRIFLQRAGIGRLPDRPAAGTVERRPDELRPQPSRVIEEGRVRPPRSHPRPRRRVGASVERPREESQAIAGIPPMAADEALRKRMHDLPALELGQEAGGDPPGGLERGRRGHRDRQLFRARPRDEAFVVVDLHAVVDDPHDERPVHRHTARPPDLDTPRARPRALCDQPAEIPAVAGTPAHIRPPEPPPHRDRPLTHHGHMLPDRASIPSRHAIPAAAAADARRRRGDEG